jgi:hypothetical protein
MEAVMKRYLLVVLLALTPLFFGLQTAFSQADTDSRGNAAPGEALPEELEDLDIKDYYIGSEAEPVGLIQTVTGHVVVLHGDTNEAYFAAKGDAIFRQDVFFTLEDSRCRIKFSTEDVITVAEDSQISIDEFVDDRDMEKKESTISMLKGKAMFYVVPLFRYKDTSTSVETPTAVCGVRGTKFGVGVREDTQTVVYGFEGDVEVYSPVDGTTQTVGEGQNLQLTLVGAGDVQDTSFGAAEQFMSDTEAPVPAKEEAGEGDEGVGEQAEVAEDKEEAAEEEESTEEEKAVEGNESPKEDDPLIILIMPPETPDEQNKKRIEDQAPTDPWPTRHFGYFSGMLTMANGTKTFKHLYLSDSLQDGDSGSATARDQLPDPDLIMQVDGSQDHNDPKITMLDIETDTIISGAFPFIMQHGDLGHNAYMEWGYWTQTQEMPGISATKYVFDNRGYYVFGDYTKYDQMCMLASNNVSGTYSGGAHGTYWTDTGGENMLGVFRADVNFASGSISSFRVDVSGPSHSVLIDGVSGSFTTGSQFELNPGTGTWRIGGSDADTGAKEAYGSVYGPNGEAIGGVWKLDNNANGAHATGMFQGTR